ncbi:MAG: hypothetical protein K6F00_01465, partial [Lachnospiraceae bacterium]|nr:hypothetical protein [Lachnospiraceae bacterium]
MEAERYEEMKNSIAKLKENVHLPEYNIYLFGHSNATEELAEYLSDIGLMAKCIIDNSKEKHGKDYKGIPIVPVDTVLSDEEDKSMVFIVSRFYEEMYAQLRRIGYTGRIEKLCDYNSFAEYSLSDETIKRKRQRALRGEANLKDLSGEYRDFFKIFCPFEALGDIYFTMMYLPEFLKKTGFDKAVVFVVGNACAKVARLFGTAEVKVLDQTYMDETVQGVIFTGDKSSYIAHQDRPYVVKLHRALSIKCIPLEKIYCCGVFGLPQDTQADMPKIWKAYEKLDDIKEGKTLILSPYAKSVTALPEQLWEDIVKDYTDMGYDIFTNVA